MDLEQLRREWDAYLLKKEDLENRSREVAKSVSPNIFREHDKIVRELGRYSEESVLEQAMRVTNDEEAQAFRAVRRQRRKAEGKLERKRAGLERQFRKDVENLDQGLLEAWDSMETRYQERFTRGLKNLRLAEIELTGEKWLHQVARELQWLVTFEDCKYGRGFMRTASCYLDRFVKLARERGDSQ